MEQTTDELLTYDQTAKLLAVSVNTVYRLLSAGDLRSHKPFGSRRHYIARRDVEELRDRRAGILSAESTSMSVPEYSPVEVRERAVAAAAPMLQAWREMLPGLASIGIAALAPAVSKIGAGSDPKR